MIYTLIDWEHEVKIPYTNDYEVKVMEEWCVEQSSRYRFGYVKGHQRIVVSPVVTHWDVSPHTFWFERKEDAMWFTLRWS